MKSGYMHPRRRSITAALCLMLCAVGVYGCFTHLFVFLDVEIFELHLLIEDLIVLAGYVLMTVGAFTAGTALPSLGLGIVCLERIVGLCADLYYSEAQKTPAELCTLVFVDIAEIVGLLLGVLMILSRLKAFAKGKNLLHKVWFLPVLLLTVSFVGNLFSNVGTLSDASLRMFLLVLVTISFVVWYTDPEGVVRWISQRIRENEEAEKNQTG